jgi:hypothetical protein
MQQTNWDQFLNFASFWFSEIVLLQQRQENLSLPYQFWDFDWTYLDCHVHTYPGKCCPQTTNKMCVNSMLRPPDMEILKTFSVVTSHKIQMR